MIHAMCKRHIYSLPYPHSPALSSAPIQAVGSGGAGYSVSAGIATVHLGHRGHGTPTICVTVQSFVLVIVTFVGRGGSVVASSPHFFASSGQTVIGHIRPSVVVLYVLHDETVVGGGGGGGFVLKGGSDLVTGV